MDSQHAGPRYFPMHQPLQPESARHYPAGQTGSFFGHQIGLDVGDPCLLDAPLSPGMVFTVEPWYYNHDLEISVFIEDVVLVTEMWCREFNRRFTTLE